MAHKDNTTGAFESRICLRRQLAQCEAKLDEATRAVIEANAIIDWLAGSVLH